MDFLVIAENFAGKSSHAIKILMFTISSEPFKLQDKQQDEFLRRD
jgi:hypothetical protein